MFVVPNQAKMLMILMISLAILLPISCTNSPIVELPEPSSPSATLEDTENGLPPQSPRSPVTGLLTEPDRPWSAIYVLDSQGKVYRLNPEDAQKVHQILSTMEAVEVLTPYHYEGQFSSPMFVILIEYAGEARLAESIYATETGISYFRYTDTVGNHGDLGYVRGISETLFDILSRATSE